MSHKFVLCKARLDDFRRWDDEYRTNVAAGDLDAIERYQIAAANTVRQLLDHIDAMDGCGEYIRERDRLEACFHVLRAENGKLRAALVKVKGRHCGTCYWRRDGEDCQHSDWYCGGWSESESEELA